LILFELNYNKLLLLIISYKFNIWYVDQWSKRY